MTQNRDDTGHSIPKANDDAQFIATLQQLRAEIGGLNSVFSSIERVREAVSAAIEGAVSISGLLIHMKEKAVAVKGDEVDPISHELFNNDYRQLLAQIDAIAKNAELKCNNALDPIDADEIISIVNADNTSNIMIPELSLGVSALGLNKTSIMTTVDAAFAITQIDSAIEIINDALSGFKLGTQRLDLVSEFVQKLSDTIKDDASELADANLVRESANLQSLQVKQQLGKQTLEIANQEPGSILSLFR